MQRTRPISGTSISQSVAGDDAFVPRGASSVVMRSITAAFSAGSPSSALNSPSTRTIGADCATR
jgi:hypothetical protein